MGCLQGQELGKVSQSAWGKGRAGHSNKGHRRHVLCKRAGSGKGAMWWQAGRQGHKGKIHKAHIGPCVHAAKKNKYRYKLNPIKAVLGTRHIWSKMGRLGVVVAWGTGRQ